MTLARRIHLQGRLDRRESRRLTTFPVNPRGVATGAVHGV